MIQSYRIEKKDNEEILIIELNYQYEFGSFKEGVESIKEQIKNFIDKANIDFNGTKVVLAVGGITLGTLLFSNRSLEIKTPEYLSPNIVSVITTKPEWQEKIEIPKTDQIIEDNDQNINHESDISSTPNQNSNQNINQTPNQNINQDSNQNQPPNIEENKPGTTIVTVYRTNGTILNLDLEEYIIGVVAAEMPASFSKEALKAQAIIARTYALRLISEGKKITDSSSTQNYYDSGQMQSVWGNTYQTYYNKIKEAVSETSELILTYQGKYIEALYHSTSNGKTEDASYVWGNSVPYLKSVDSHWDIGTTYYNTTINKDFINVLNLLGIDTNNTNVEVLERNASGRVVQVKIGDKTFNGVNLRSLLGLKSTDFDLNVVDGNLVITTRGYGHGVGMSQYGANGMAKEGYNYEQILKHYYTNVDLVKKN